MALLLPHWEAVHATGGGQWGAELRDDYHGGGSPSRRLLTGWGPPSGSSTPETPSIVIKRARRNVVRAYKPCVPESNPGCKNPSLTPIQPSRTVLGPKLQFTVTPNQNLGFYQRRGHLNGGVHWGVKTAVYTATFLKVGCFTVYSSNKRLVYMQGRKGL